MVSSRSKLVNLFNKEDKHPLREDRFLFREDKFLFREVNSKILEAFVHLTFFKAVV